jgi:hypothetical protein
MMARHRFVGLAAGVLVLLAACNQEGEERTAASTTLTPPTILKADLIAGVRDAAQDLYDMCAAGDGTAVGSLVEPHLRDQPWPDACQAFADHSIALREHQAAVEGTFGTVHVRLEHVDGAVHEEDWYFERHDPHWRLAHPPAVLAGAWDHDQHRWLDTTASAPPQPVHPTDDGHPHGQFPASTASTAPAAPPTSPPATGHYDGDGHDHTPPTNPPTGHYDGDGHDHTQPTSPPTGHYDGDDGHNEPEPDH